MKYLKRAAFAAIALAAGWSGPAAAIPYANAVNALSGIAITGGTGSILPLVTGTATQGTTSAQYGGIVTGFNSIGVVGGVTDVAQATAGPGPFPGANDFGMRAGLLGGMIGSRADGQITAGVAGTVTARTVAESYGNAIGSAQGKNTASINFVATLSDPGTIQIAFNLRAFMQASTAVLIGETANATIKNDILITDALGNVVFEFTPNGNSAGNVFGGTVLADPFNANGQVNSSFGVPAVGTFNQTGAFAAVSNLLAAGTYNIAVVSSSQTSIQPGEIPEPSSIALLGLGLLLLGVCVHHRPAMRDRHAA
jgi:hypothetical protein